MKRSSFNNFKTFLNTKFWFFNSSKELSFSELSRQMTLAAELNYKQLDADFFNLNDFNFNSSRRLKNLSFIRLLRKLNSNGQFNRFFATPDLFLKLSRVRRFIRSNYLARRYWWQLARKFRPFLSFKKFLSVFKVDSDWRFPFKQNQMNTLSLKNSRLKFFNLNEKKSRFLFLPKPLFKRLKVFHFLNKGFWRSLESLVKVTVRFTLNNLFVTLSVNSGKNLITFSSGSVGFKGTTKLTSYAIERVALNVSKFLRKRRLKSLYLVFNSGAVGYKSKIFIETLIYNSLIVKYLTVSDSVPHNGVRARKTKRR